MWENAACVSYSAVLYTRTHNIVEKNGKVLINFGRNYSDLCCTYSTLKWQKQRERKRKWKIFNRERKGTVKKIPTAAEKGKKRDNKKDLKWGDQKNIDV